MNTIIKANSEYAKQLFNIMVRATEIGCSSFYPSEIISIWHKGRSSALNAGSLLSASLPKNVKREETNEK
ncbi:MAG: hypothetical protein PVI26_10145 [Chitinispirillia bacterium]